jgi:hypothetical protein
MLKSRKLIHKNPRCGQITEIGAKFAQISRFRRESGYLLRNSLKSWQLGHFWNPWAISRRLMCTWAELGHPTRSWDRIYPFLRNSKAGFFSEKWPYLPFRFESHPKLPIYSERGHLDGQHGISRISGSRAPIENCYFENWPKFEADFDFQPNLGPIF